LGDANAWLCLLISGVESGGEYGFVLCIPHGVMMWGKRNTTYLPLSPLLGP
jgi:hypothetical protein